MVAEPKRLRRATSIPFGTKGCRRRGAVAGEARSGRFYDKASDRPAKSATVFNLGYTPEVAEIYPHVARLSGGVATDHPRERVRRQSSESGTFSRS